MTDKSVDMERVLGQIRKLLSMAADTSSPNEAAIAAGRARKMMDKYQVSLADLKDEDGFGFATVDKQYRFVPMWKSFLAVDIARLNDCKASFKHEWKSINQSYSKQIMFQGFESDVIVASNMYDYLTKEIERLCGRYMAELGYTSYKASVGDSYKKSASLVLCRRLKELLEGRKRDTVNATTGTSLVVYKMAAVEAEFGKAEYKKTAPNIKNRNASSRGQSDAMNISFNDQLSSGVNSAALEIRQ